MKKRLYRLLPFILIMGVWEVLALSQLVYPAYLPRFSETILVLLQLLVSEEFLSHIVATLLHTFVGFALAAVIGVSGGVLLGSWPAFNDIFRPIINFLRPLPAPVIMPLAILFLGIGDTMKVFIVAFGAVWPPLINTIDGVRDVEPQLLETGKTLGFSKFEIAEKIVVPAASPYIVSGLRLGSHIALIIASASEMIAGSKGLGFFIYKSQLSFRIPELYAGILTIGLLGYLISKLFSSVEKRVMGWHQRYQQQV